MKKLKPVDVVIVGGGWTGLAMAKEITGRTALNVVVLERGPARKTSDYMDMMDEVDNALRHRMMQNIAEETVTHRFSRNETAVPVRQYGHFLPGAGTGGAGEHWTGIAYRFLEDEFVLATAMREKYGASKLPEGLSVQDWGVTYAELEPYYWKAEQMMGVGGKAGNLRGKLIEGGNIFEAPRQQEFPNPPHKTTYTIELFGKAARELGYHPYPTPAATLSQTYTNPDGITRPGCAYCNYCMLYGCMIEAKAQPTNTLLPIVQKRKTFTLRNHAWVRRVIHRNGKAEGVMYMDEHGEEVLQPAHIVVLASWTMNNTRLLYLSKIGDPYDPETAKGTLGKNLTHQARGDSGGVVLFEKRVLGHGGAGGMGFRLSDFDGFNGIDQFPGVLRGGSIGGGGVGGHPISSFGNIPPGAARRNWGSEWKKAALEWHGRIVAAGGFSGEHLAYRQNYMDLDPTYTDKWGDPLLRHTIDWTEHEHKQAAMAGAIAAKLARQMAALAGAKYVQGGGRGGGSRTQRYQVVSYNSTHVQGGAIMGSSPETSVVNTYLQHWKMPNLFVVGGSAFPQNASGNPTLTALAITYRSADALIERYLQHPGVIA
ncbi:MAG TPA: GMC family oxidoreductase [Bryobacterales bacterium]|jgi:gluconate 2-dehydrogenase alpha chain|nr:GMC family oxidoreductase [Bryobacterales bacterium]